MWRPEKQSKQDDRISSRPPSLDRGWHVAKEEQGKGSAWMDGGWKKGGGVGMAEYPSVWVYYCLYRETGR